MANTDELVTALFSKGVIESFRFVGDPRVETIAPGGPNFTVYILLKDAPIYQTVTMQWDMLTSPKDCYAFHNNVIIAKFAGGLSQFNEHPLIISYTPDPRVKRKFSRLSVKGTTVYADDVALLGWTPK